jgi:hypothetical protein
MPIIRQVHDAFDAMIREQERSVAALAAQAAAVRTDAESIAGLRALPMIRTIVGGRLRMPDDLQALARCGEPEPAHAYAKSILDRENTAAACRERIAGGSPAAVKAVHDEAERARGSANLHDKRLADLARRIAQQPGLGFASAGAAVDAATVLAQVMPRFEALSRHEQRYRRRRPLAHLAGLFDRDRQRVRRAAREYATSHPGADLFADARAAMAAQQEGRRHRENAAALEQRAHEMLKQGDDAEHGLASLPTDDQIMEGARSSAVQAATSRRGALALRALVGNAVPDSILADLARAERLRELAAGIEAHVAAMSKFREQLAAQMPKLRRGQSQAPTQFVRIDLDALQSHSAAILSGMDRLAEALHAVREAGQRIGALRFDEDEARLRPASAGSADSFDNWWATLGAIYFAAILQDDPSARAIIPFVPDLAPGRLQDLCGSLPPDSLREMSNACHLTPHAPDIHGALDLGPVPQYAVAAGDAGPDLGSVHFPDMTLPADFASLTADITQISVDVSSIPDVSAISVDSSSIGYDSSSAF